jgi:hypothetical protein
MHTGIGSSMVLSAKASGRPARGRKSRQKTPLSGQRGNRTPRRSLVGAACSTKVETELRRSALGPPASESRGSHAHEAIAAVDVVEADPGNIERVVVDLTGMQLGRCDGHVMELGLEHLQLMGQPQRTAQRDSRARLASIALDRCGV